MNIPYIPGYLAFREMHYFTILFDRMKQNVPEKMPQVMFLDGNGVLHPRGAGIASHFGVLCNIPSIGGITC